LEEKMSRTGKRPIAVPQGVKVKLSDHEVTMQGAKGTLTLKMPDVPLVEIKISENEIAITRKEECRDSRRQQGLIRSLLNNQLVGVTEGYKKELDIVGIGYKAEVKGKELLVSVGYAYPKVFHIPDGLSVKVEGGNRIFLESIDKWLIGQAASTIRRIRPPEPYKGKGIRHFDEQIKRKVGKAAAGTGG
jgi:large subunit ribosomal protein L6